MNKKLLIIIIAAVVVLIGAGVAVYFIFFAGAGEPKEPELTVSYYKPGDEPIHSNISGSNRIVKMTVVLELSSPVEEAEALLAQLAIDKDVIRDALTFALRQKTEPELRSKGIDDVLRKDLTDALKQCPDLDMTYLETLYFYDFVLQ